LHSRAIWRAAENVCQRNGNQCFVLPPALHPVPLQDALHWVSRVSRGIDINRDALKDCVSELFGRSRSAKKHGLPFREFVRGTSSHFDIQS
jgi:hypothetical protein